MVSAAFRSIFALTDPEELQARWDEVTDMFTAKFPKASASMRAAKPVLLGYLGRVPSSGGVPSVMLGVQACRSACGWSVLHMRLSSAIEVSVM